MTHAPAPAPSPRRLLPLFFASGAAALVYEVLWGKELGRLFGVGAYAAAATLAVFFGGLAAGGVVWGRRTERMRNPLRQYARLEAAIGLSALLYFLLIDLYRALLPLLGAIADRPAPLLLVKLGLATAILFPPAFLIGGTLPVVAHALVRERSDLGTRVTALYAVNTLGAAAGALAAGFVLPRLLGYAGSYLVAIASNWLVAALAWIWSRGLAATAPRLDDGEAPLAAASGAISRGRIAAVAAVSGFATLALEVVWTRMYAQVLQNSVYTFAIILAVFLVGLAAGSALAHVLCRSPRSGRTTLALLLSASGVLVGLSPWLFERVSGALDYLRSDLGFWPYVGAVLAGTAIGIGPATIAMGAVFPFLMKLSEGRAGSAGRTVGRLAAINTTAAIAGSLLAGFVLLRLLGTSGSLRWLAIVYFALALAVGPWRGRAGRATALLPAAALLALLLAPVDDRRVRLDEEAGEELVEAWDGPAGSVAVVRHDGGSLRMRVNSSYNIGTSASAVTERLQGQLPLLLHPRARSVFFLGLGTGITASGALDFDVERVVVCEVNADVIRASREHFAPWLEGLFDDPRVEVLAEDGRAWLAASRERFDVVVSDIFQGFEAGIGSLYTREHFRAVRARLNPGGIFVQWVPMFDTSVPELEILSRTMLDVFPSVTLWRRSHSPSYPVYALVGRLADEPLDPRVLRARIDLLRASGSLDPDTWLLQIPFAAYAGNLRALEARFRDAPLNTDDRTVLEYVAPITERNARGAGTSRVLAWDTLLAFCEGLLGELPPERDPHLVRLSDDERSQVRAGLALYAYALHSRLGDDVSARSYLEEYRAHLPGGESP
jgi:spermidine synthase